MVLFFYNSFIISQFQQIPRLFLLSYLVKIIARRILQCYNLVSPITTHGSIIYGSTKSEIEVRGLKDSGFEFKTGKHGLEKILGPLESEIMEVVWSMGKVYVREVHEALNSGDDKNIAYTTVMTTMSRLAKKGILKTFKDGNAYAYEAALNKGSFLDNAVGEVVDGLLDDFSEPAIAHFVEKIKQVDPLKMKQLEELIALKKLR